MKKARRKRNTLFAFALLCSIILSLSIPLLVLGAVWELGPLLATGITLMALTFYAIPLLWIRFGNAVSLCRTLRVVAELRLTAATDIASHLGTDVAGVRSRLRYAVANNYLAGYGFDGEVLFRFDTTPRLQTVRCASCGAPNEVAELPARCAWCGGALTE